jgi:predicted  nucleic acid-binding Zn-ribbon protein
VDASALLAIFGAAVAVIGLGSAVVIGLRGKALETDLGLVRDRLKDSDDELERKERRLADLERDYDELKRDSARKDAALARIGEQAASGAELLQVASALKEASGLSRDHDREAATRHASVIKVMREVRDEQKKTRETLEGRTG